MIKRFVVYNIPNKRKHCDCCTKKGIEYIFVVDQRVCKDRYNLCLLCNDIISPIIDKHLFLNEVQNSSLQLIISDEGFDILKNFCANKTSIEDDHFSDLVRGKRI